MATRVKQDHAVSVRVARAVLGVGESCCQYKAKLATENALVADWLLRLTLTHKRWGFAWNQKRVYQIYRELELNLRIKPRR